MTEGAPHRVRRQVWRIRAPSADAAFALRAEVRAAWEDTLLPALEAAFDQAADDGRVIRIPRLELRLRLDRPADLAAELPRLIREAAGVELALARRGGIPPVWEADGGGAVSPAEEGRATLLHYLRTGALPWAAAGAAAGDATAGLRAAARAEGPRLLDLAASSPGATAFAFRLLQLLEEADAAAWIAALPARVPSLWRRVLLRLLAPAAGEADLPGAGGDAGPAAAWAVPPRHARLEAAAVLLVTALAAPSAGALDDSPAALAAAARTMDGGAGDALRSLLASLPGTAVRRASAKDSGRRTTRDARPAPAAARADDDVLPPATGRDAEAKRESASSPPPAGSRGAEGGGPASAARLAEAAAARPQGSAPGEDFALSVAHAGLILLHSFIGPLLEHTGIREGDAIPPDRLQRAAALLHYLATGRDEVLEWELGLVKVLLGLTPDDPLLVADGCLRAEDRAECEDLLQSAIGHWSVLRGASPAVVRETFLQRGGLLRRDAQGWTLRVEPAPFDVLLAHLPWSISVARLPWMPHPIYTEWTTTH